MFKSIAFEVIGEQRLHCERYEQRVERLLKALPGRGAGSREGAQPTYRSIV